MFRFSLLLTLIRTDSSEPGLLKPKIFQVQDAKDDKEPPAVNSILAVTDKDVEDKW
jgi:hypothetical protein